MGWRPIPEEDSMSTRTRWFRRATAGTVLALAIPLLASAQNAVAAESLNVNLGSVTGPATGIGEGFQNGSGPQADVNTIIAQAKRLTQPPYHAQYQVLLSDIFGADAGQPSNTVYPCTSGNCSNWVTFLDTVIPELQATGLKFAYEIWNEPELSI